MLPQPDDDVWIRQALGRYAITREAALRDEIAERTLWLAARGARRFSGRGEPHDDLIQVGRIGLLKAIDRYDPGFGVPFGAFATPTIVGELRRHFRDHTWSVHVPRRTKDLRPAVNEATSQLSSSLGRSPTVAEIAGHLALGDDAVIEAIEANSAYRAGPLDPHREHAVDSPEFDAVLNRELIRGLLDQLGPRQRTIIELRFFDELSQAQIAEKIGISQVHVGRLLAISLSALRHLLDPEARSSARSSASEHVARHTTVSAPP